MTNTHTNTGHALCSPSGADRWMNCPGSVAMEMIEPPSTSEYAEEGTRAHFLAGVYFGVADGAAATPTVTDLYPEDMHEFVRGYVDDVLARVEAFKTAGATSVKLLVEQAVPLEPITGEKGATGTSDVIIVAEFADEVIFEVDDLKYGMGVKVSANDNPQLKIYAAAALIRYQTQTPNGKPVRKIVMRIHQPRLSETPSEYEMPAQQLLKWIAEEAGPKATLALRLIKQSPSAVMANLNPGEDQCRFCRALHRCQKAADLVHQTVFDSFQAIDDPEAKPITPETYTGGESEYEKLLPVFMARTGLVETWCKAIRGKVETLLLAGKPVEGFKLVQGRKGNRKWNDEDQIAAILEIHDVPKEKVYKPRVLRTPADMGDEFGKKRAPENLKKAWASVDGLWTQTDGGISVAPESDDRPAYAPVSESDFDTFDVSDMV